MNSQSDDQDQSLTLGLGFPSSSSQSLKNHHIFKAVKPPFLVGDDLPPSLTLSLSPETYRRPPPSVSEKKFSDDPPSSATASSLSNNAVVSVKRERESPCSDDLDAERGCNSRASDEDEDGSGGVGAAATTTRKKLRLSKEQSALLEESFKQHSTLNPKQKQALADGLGLQPRQVEVWFQNRRARTKLKQTEVDCEYLKKCCETLTDENRRLQKELEELKALKVAAQPLYMHLPAATLTMCPSCERIAAGGPPPSKTAFAKPHFYASFPNQSAAC